MFEVGKKYRQVRPDIAGLREVLVLFKTDKTIFVRYTENYMPSFVGKELAWVIDDIKSNWEEYKEPVVTRDFRYLTEYSTGELYHTKQRTNYGNLLAKVEIIHTEGVGVEYKVLEYYGTNK